MYRWPDETSGVNPRVAKHLDNLTDAPVSLYFELVGREASVIRTRSPKENVWTHRRTAHPWAWAGGGSVTAYREATTLYT